MRLSELDQHFSQMEGEQFRKFEYTILGDNYRVYVRLNAPQTGFTELDLSKHSGWRPSFKAGLDHAHLNEITPGNAPGYFTNEPVRVAVRDYIVNEIFNVLGHPFYGMFIYINPRERDHKFVYPDGSYYKSFGEILGGRNNNPPGSDFVCDGVLYYECITIFPGRDPYCN